MTTGVGTGRWPVESPNGHTDRKPKNRFPLVTSAALDSEDYSPRWIVNGVLCALVPAIIGGLFKTCKSLIAIALAIAVASGKSFLDTFEVGEPVPVIYFSGEGGPTVAQDYGRRTARSMGLQLGDLSNLHWCFSVPRLESLEHLDEMVKVIDDTGAKVVFIDNLMLALSGDDAGNVMKMGGILGNVIRVCAERDVTPVFIHHFKRSRATADQFAPGELLDLTQAGAAEVAGQWTLLTKREAYNPDEPGEHRLWLSIGGRVGHSSLHALDIHEGRLSDTGGRRWETELYRPDEVRMAAEERQAEARRRRADEKAAASLEGDRGEIVKIIAKLKTPETKNVIRGRISFAYSRFTRAFSSLADDGTIRPADLTKGKGQHVYEAWRLRNDDEI